MNIVLLLAVVTLAIIAIVLVAVAAKLVKGASKPSAAPSPPTFTPATATPTPQPPKAVPVQSRRDGEAESFDISAKNHHVLWCCPCCGTENSSGSRCTVCAQSRS